MAKLTDSQQAEIASEAESLSTQNSLRQHSWDATAWAYDLVLDFERRMTRRRAASAGFSWYGDDPSLDRQALVALNTQLLLLATAQLEDAATWRIETEPELEPYRSLLLERKAEQLWFEHLRWLLSAPTAQIVAHVEDVINRGLRQKF